MLLPKRVKYRRVHRGRMTGKAMRGNTVSQGDFGIVADVYKRQVHGGVCADETHSCPVY